MFKISETPVYCISLKNREDRRILMRKEFTRVNIPFSFVDAVDASDVQVPELCTKQHEYNYAQILACAVSHRSLIASGCTEYMIILEDDVVFCDDVIHRLEYVESLKLDFDMLYLGGHFNTQDAPTPAANRYMYRVSRGMAGTFGYIIKTSLSQFIQRNYTYNFGIDEFFDKAVQPRFDCFAFIPFMVAHLDGYSDVAKHYVEYNCNLYFEKTLPWNDI